MELIIVSSPRANVWNKLVSTYVKGLEQCLRRSRGYASFSSRYFTSLTSFPITTTLFLGPNYNELPVDPLGQSLLTLFPLPGMPFPPSPPVITTHPVRARKPVPIPNHEQGLVAPSSSATKSPGSYQILQ